MNIDPPPLPEPELRPPARADGRACVKICGVTRVDEAIAIADLGADFVGLILAESPRRVTVEQAAEIAAALHDRSAEPVLVVRDVPVADLAPIVARVATRWVQLHGSEDAAYISALRDACPGIRLIKVVESSSVPDAVLEGAVTAVEVVLLDQPKSPSSNARREGLSPAALQQLAACQPPMTREQTTQLRQVITPALWIAGGLTPESVGQYAAIHLFAGFDVASGVESSPGRKDLDKVARFIRAARG